MLRRIRETSQTLHFQVGRYSIHTPEGTEPKLHANDLREFVEEQFVGLLVEVHSGLEQESVISLHVCSTCRLCITHSRQESESSVHDA